ncbi:MAG TPA: radical SAM protein, partial [Anaeromyxobacteraceae bacterium]
MRVLVVHPPLSLGRDFVDYPWASDLGAVQLAGALRERHEARLLDALAMPGASVAPRPDGRSRLGAPVEALLEAARAGAPWDAAVVALTPFHRPPARDDLLGDLLTGLRSARAEAPLLLADCYQSGQHYLEAPGEAVLASYPEVDAWVKYEAEVAVPALLAGLTSGAGERRALIGEPADLAALPEPAWDLVDLAARDALQRQAVERLGRGQWPFPIDGRTLPLVTSRGCPWDCLHCSSNPGRAPGAPKAQRRMPAERLRRLCESLVRRHGATRLLALDEMLNAAPGHLGALLDAVEALGVGLEIPNGLRADRLDRAAVARLRGRVTTLSVSAESGSQRVVDEVVGKRLDLGEVERVAADCRDEGLPLMIHWIIGLPGERPEEVNATLAMAADLEARHGATPSVQFATPLPGTRLAARCGAAPLDDYGPAFQARPSATDPLVPPEALSRFAWAFERR